MTALAALLLPGIAKGQQGGPGVEQWRSFLSYNQVNSVATDGTTFFCATNSGLFTYNREDGSLESYSKVNGMSDIGINAVGYDPTSRTTIVGYSNSNIDFFKDGTFYNLPDLVLAPSSGDKTINNIVAADAVAYLSTSLGLFVLNLNKREVRNQVIFRDTANLEGSVLATMLEGNTLYAATSVGLFRTSRDNPNIQNAASWERLDGASYSHLGYHAGRLYLSRADSLFTMEGSNTPNFSERMAGTIMRLDPGTEGVWISVKDEANARGYIFSLSNDGSHTDSLFTGSPSQVCQLPNGELWFGDNSGYVVNNYFGLRKRISATETAAYIPDGPVTSTSFDVSAHNGELWVAHGGKSISWNVSRNRAMFSHFADGHWTNFPWVDNNPWVQDFIRILKDPNTGTLYAASYSGGLYEQKADGSRQVYNAGYLDNAIGNPGIYYASGMALDDAGNLWITNNYASQSELVVKTPDGRWLRTRNIDANTGHSAADVLIDSYGQKWFMTVDQRGVIVYNDNGTLENMADDSYRVFRSGENSGNLPDNNVMSIAEDKDGAIWVGTTNGIGIINCGDQAISDPSCKAELRVLQNDEFAGYLFEGQIIKALAVDGANRKWVGTTNGVWLISDDAEKTLYRFTAENSPLPSDNIERINIDPVTGDVYFSTDRGLVSFRGTATEGQAEHEESLFVYPNPVPSGYQGMIAVRGIAENADVRFTDISGQLVYRTTALGGQAVWNGKDYTGRKAQSGVYLVFAVNRDGTQKATAKFILQH